MRALMHLHKLNEKLWFINYMCVSYQPDLINNSELRQMFLFGLISNFKDKNGSLSPINFRLKCSDLKIRKNEKFWILLKKDINNE